MSGRSFPRDDFEATAHEQLYQYADLLASRYGRETVVNALRLTANTLAALEEETR